MCWGWCSGSGPGKESNASLPPQPVKLETITRPKSSHLPKLQYTSANLTCPPDLPDFIYSTSHSSRSGSEELPPYVDSHSIPGSTTSHPPQALAPTPPVSQLKTVPRKPVVVSRKEIIPQTAVKCNAHGAPQGLLPPIPSGIGEFGPGWVERYSGDEKLLGRIDKTADIPHLPEDGKGVYAPRLI